ncbi:unnamed protein product [Adineta steineri]|uniref:Uncharacterized protein n=1 Tax=Adineta steineri TaxID=433720 RepID=A0A814PMY9_9BILA|nr:unnamed protein product [Adineta steineri]CAF4095169.1 unnamed protein product [Adineta steineri]
MYFKDLLFIIFLLFVFNNYWTQGQNITTTTNVTASTTTTNVLSTIACPENDPSCSLIKDEIKTSGNGIRRLFYIFVGCLLTTCLIIAMIISYNRIIAQHPSTNTNINNRFHNILQTIGLNNLTKTGRFPFFSVSNNNQPSANHRQGETSRSHLNENQDEALLFDDPYTDGIISGGIHGSSTNPYKSLTLSVT